MKTSIFLRACNKPIFLLALCLMLLTASQVKAYYNESLHVDIYTLTGEYAQNYVCTNSTDGKNKETCEYQSDLSNPILKHELGTLFIKEGFILNFVDGQKSISDLGIDAATATAISGKPIYKLSTWVATYTSDTKFLRSTSTYNIGQLGTYITVSIKGSVDGITGLGETDEGGLSVKPGKPTINLSAIQPSISEGGSSIGQFLIESDAPKNKKITVLFSLTGTAKNGKDYQKIKRKIVIPKGAVSAYVNIIPLSDQKFESSEYVVLKLSKSSSYKLGVSKSSQIEIKD